MNKKQIIELLENKFADAIRVFNTTQTRFNDKLKKYSEAERNRDYNAQTYYKVELDRLNAKITERATFADELVHILMKITDNGYDAEYQRLYDKYDLHKK